MGPLPGENEVSGAFLHQFHSLLELIRSELSEKPLTDDEARSLVGLFGIDDAYGVAWSLLHLIETAPNWPIADGLEDTSNEWVDRLKRRVDNARRR